MICVENLCVLRAKEKCMSPAHSTHALCCRTARGLPVEVSARGVGCRGAAHCAAVGCSWEGGGAYGGQGKPVGGGWASLLRGCQLIGP